MNYNICVFDWSFPLLVIIWWLFSVIQAILLLIAVQFELLHLPITPAIVHLRIFLIYQSLYWLWQWNNTFELSNPHLSCSPYVSTNKRQLFNLLFLLKKCFFQTQNLRRSLNDKTKAFVSNYYATHFSLASSLS